MNMVEILDENGIKISVKGIYYISNNNYYFIYTKEEFDEENHIILYITKVLREFVNTSNGQVPTGYIVGVKIEDENEYNIVKSDIVNIVDEKQNGKEAVVRYLELSMLNNFKVKGYRIFRLDQATYYSSFEKKEQADYSNDNHDYKSMYEEEVNKNNILQHSIDELNDKINRLKEIIN